MFSRRKNKRKVGERISTKNKHKILACFWKKKTQGKNSETNKKLPKGNSYDQGIGKSWDQDFGVQLF